MAAHDDEVHLLALGGVHDGLARITLPDEERDVNAGRATARHELLRGCLPAAPHLVQSSAETPAGEPEGAKVDHADNEQLGPEIVREVECLEAGFFRSRGEVRGQKDPTDTPAQAGSALFVRFRLGAHVATPGTRCVSMDEWSGGRTDAGSDVRPVDAGRWSRHRRGRARWTATLSAVTDRTVQRPLSESPDGEFLVVAAIDALETATRAIAGELDLGRVLQIIVDSVRDLVDARYAALGIVDGGGRIERFITSGISPEDRERIGSPPRGNGLLGLIVREARTYRIPDIGLHPDAYGFPDGHPPMRSFLGVPVRTGGQPVGNFYLTDKNGADEFSEQDQRLVEMFALHAAIAIQNARLHARVRQLAVLDERLRIGRDLHDGIIQSLYAVALSLEDVSDLMAEDPADASARIDRAIDRLNSSIGEIRTFIVGLGSNATEIAIGARLAGLADELLLSSGAPMSLDLDLTDVGEVDARLDAEAATQLLQMAREALSNAIRHSGAPQARLSVHVIEGDVVLTVEDDGRGFDRTVPPRAGHLGLANLHDRAVSVGGSLEISSRPGSGTRIIVRLPTSSPENITQ